MYRTAFRSLFVAAALFLTTTACDKGDTKADAKKDDKKAAADAKKEAEPTPPADTGAEPPADTGPMEPAAEGGEPAAEGGEAPAAEGGEPAAEGGEAPAAEGGEAPADGGDSKPEAKPEKAPTEKAPTEDKPEATAKVDGKPIFDGKCKSCHGADGKGDTTIGKKVNIPSLAGTSLSKAKVVAAIENGVPDTKMKAYKDKLSKDEIDAVASYVKKL